MPQKSKFQEWLESDSYKHFVFDEGNVTNTTFIKVAKNDDFDYLFAQTFYSGSHIQRDDHLYFSGIDCSKLGYFDELEYDCWDLVKKYCERLGIKIESGDISFDIAKGIQDHIIEQFQEAGVNFNFEDIEQVDSPVMKM